MKLKLYYLSLFFLGMLYQGIAQTLGLVPGQPQNRHFDEIYIPATGPATIQYFNTSFGGRDFHRYDGTEISDMNLPTNNTHYLGQLEQHIFFGNFDDPTLIYRYDFQDGSITNLTLPIGYRLERTIGSFQGKLYLFLEDINSEVKVMHYYQEEIFVAVANPAGVFPIQYLRPVGDKLCFIFEDEQAKRFVYTFDGINYEALPMPITKKLANIPSQEQEDEELFMVYVNLDSTEPSLYRYNGNVVKAIDTPVSTRFKKILGRVDETIYFTYRHLPTGILQVYAYDGTQMTPIPQQVGYSIRNLLGAFGGNAYFSYREIATGINYIFRYDEAQLVKINQPENYQLEGVMGRLGNTGYFLYSTPDSKDVILALTAGTEELMSLANFPLDQSPIELWFEQGGFLYWGLAPANTPADSKLYAYDGTTFTPIEHPAGLVYSDLAFRYQDEVYLQYLNSDNEIILYKLEERILSAVTIAASTALDWQVYPNPTQAKVKVQRRSQAVPVLGSMRASLYTAFGQLIEEQVGESKEEVFNFDLKDRPAGHYFLRLQTSAGTVVRQLIKH